MLDDEPNDLSSTPAEAAPAKVVRRRRATKAAAAPAAETTSPDPIGSTSTEAAEPAAEAAEPAAGAAEPAAGAAEPAGEPPAKRPRKAAKKAAPRKRVAKAAPDAGPAEPAPISIPDTSALPGDGAPGGAESAAVAPQSADDDLTLDASLSPVAEELPVAEESAPARSRRRRAPAIVTFQAPEPAAPLAQSPPAPAAADAPAADDALEGAAPRRRRRAGTAGVVPAGALVPAQTAVPAAGADEAVGVDAPATGPDDDDDDDRPRRRRRGRRGRGPRQDDEPAVDEAVGSDSGDDATSVPEQPADAASDAGDDDEELNADGTRRRRRRRRRSGSGAAAEDTGDDVPSVVHVREPRAPRVRGASAADEDGVRGITGSTRMAAKRARRQEGRDSGRRRPPVLSEAEFLARREAVDRTMVVRQQGDRTQIAVLEDGVLVEHYVTKASAQSYAGNVYLGKVQNVLPSMEAAFIDIGKGKNGVLYAGEVNYDAQLAGHGPRKIEQVLKSGQDVLVQVSKDPIGHKGARLTSQVSLPGRYLVYVPEGSMTGISRKLPDTERTRLKAILKKIVPDDAGVIIRTAAEGASEEELTADVRRLQAQWEVISGKVAAGGGPVLLHAEPDLVIRVVRDVFNEDFTSLVVQGDSEWDTIKEYVDFVAPDLASRISRHTADVDVFAVHRIDEQLAKALDRKVWLPSGGSLVVDRTEAMFVIDVNTGKYVGKGGNLEETVTRNNLEAAEEIARQLRLRDLGGIIVVDFIDMVLESNRDLVVRRLVECLGRDRTKHQVAEVTSLGLVQMTRKRVGQGLLESFSETCETCAGRGVIVSDAPVDTPAQVERFDDRGPRDRKAAAAGPALVAAATGGRADPAPSSSGAAASPPASSDPVAAAGSEPSPAAPRARRRRGGRGAGAATSAAVVEAEPDALLESGHDPQPVDGPQGPELQGPVLQEPVLQEPEPATEVVTVVQDGLADTSGAAPRRRRRATSRPAGPPSTD